MSYANMYGVPLVNFQGLANIGKSAAQGFQFGSGIRDKIEQRKTDDLAIDTLYGKYANQQSASQPSGGVFSRLGGIMQESPAPADRNTARVNQAFEAGGYSKAPSSNKEFFDKIAPYAMEAASRTGIDPKIIMAQAALETGFGKKVKGNNYFGIKAHGKPTDNKFMTTEIINGKPVKMVDSFMGYENMRDSVNGYADFMLENPRYKDMMAAQGIDAQIAALQASGYATDPNYGKKITSIARRINLPSQEAISTYDPPQAEPQGQILSSDQFSAVMRSSLPAGIKKQMVQGRAQGYQVEAFGDGGLMQVAPDGKRSILLQPQKEAALTTQQRNFQAAKEDPAFGEYLTNQKRAGATSVNVNTGEGSKFYDELDKSNAKMFSSLQTEGAKAQANLVRIDRLEGLLSNVQTGAAASFQQLAGNFGINTEGLDDLQAAQALINQIVPGQRPPGSGPMSDADLALFIQSMPRIINQPGGNAKIIETLRGLAQYQIGQGRIANMVANREISPAEGRNMLMQLPNPLEQFKAPAEQQAAPEQGQVMDGYRFNGGDPADPNSWEKVQ